MIPVQFPAPDFRIRQEEGRDMIFDELRKKWVTLSPEEWVRQNFIRHLVHNCGYSPALMAVEKEIRLGELRKRFDLLVYDAGHRPFIMVECKAREVKLEEKVLEQALRYNIAVPVTYILITNGHYTYGWKKNGQQLEVITEIPVAAGA